MTARADVLVIGAGIAGASAAAALCADARVVVLEAEDAPGRHATGRSAAIFIRNYGGPEMRALNAVSEPALADPGDLADGPLLSPRGQMMIATEDEAPALSAYLEGAQGLERLTGAEAAALFPPLRAERIAAAAYESAARDIDVDRLLQGCLRRLRGRGGRLETDAPARRIARAGGVWRVETPRGAFEAPILIDAAGAWADEVALLAGVAPMGLRALRRSAALLPAPDGSGGMAGWPLVASAAMAWYAKPEAGRLMVSPADADPVAPQDAWPDDLTLAEGLHRFEQAVTFPVSRVLRSWAGLRTFAPDDLPVVGFAPDAEGFFWLAGQGGHGVQTAPALAALTADLCLGRAPGLGAELASALAPRRFTGAAAPRQQG